MARKELGHIELHWQCPNCDGINPGREKSCRGCGAPQPDDVEFKQFSRQELIKDEALLEQAKAGPDIHCAFCGTRNPGSATVCSQCGSDLSEGTKREAGRVVGAFQEGTGEDVKCPSCGSNNPHNALRCSNCGSALQQLEELEPDGDIHVESKAQSKGRRKIPVVLIIVFAVICVGAVAIAVLSGRTKPVTGVVDNVTWERSIAIEAFGPVEHDDWYDELPGDAENISCEEAYRYTSNEPEPNSVEVCGTPYSVDSGDGFAEVVQDCEYQVYDDYCSYTVLEWAVVDTAVLSGNNLNPAWPSPNLTSDQRLGDDRRESYTVIFDTGSDTYSYAPDSFNEFQRFDIGSSWTLNVNTFGSVLSVEP